MAEKKRGANEPEPRPIIVKKVIVEGHGGHHGGAWKVAYADFVTAMMAFFLLMWLLGATTEKQRKALADFFTPTLASLRTTSAGSTGLLGGDSLMGKENYPTTGGQGNRAITIPRDASGVKEQGGRNVKATERIRFQQVKKALEQRMAADAGLRRLMKNIRFTETREGLRIDLIDEADFSMFSLATDRLLPQARRLIGEVAKVLQAMPNDIIVRGHTDGLPYAAGRTMNNWMLSSARAEATRKALSDAGIGGDRFARIEGVADRDPFVPGDIYDPRNRRMSIILAWSRDGARSATDADADARGEDARIAADMRERDSPLARAREEDMGRTALPPGAVLYGPKPGSSGEKAKF
jgi:chemotaxis protein MotB